MKDNFLQFLALTKRSGNLLEGYNKCEEALKKHKIKLLILSPDSSQNTKEKFRKYSLENNIPIIESYSKEELGNILGRDEISVIGVTDENMSSRLINIFKSVDNI